MRGFLVLSAIFTILALYLDNVLPKEFGVRQPFYYPFTKKYWFGESMNEPAAESDRLLDHDSEQP